MVVIRPAPADHPFAPVFNPVAWMLRGEKGGRIRLWGDDGAGTDTRGNAVSVSNHALTVRSAAGRHVLVRNAADALDLFRVDDTALAFGAKLDWREAATPPSPSAGSLAFYAQSGHLFRVNSAGATAAVMDGSFYTTRGMIAYGTTANQFTMLALGTTWQELTVNNAATAPVWTSGVLAVGTGVGDLFYAPTAHAVTRLALGATGTVLKPSGTTAPTWAAITASDITAGAITQRPAVAVGSTDPTVTGASIVALANPTVVMTTAGGDVDLHVGTKLSNSAVTTMNLWLRVDSGGWTIVAECVNANVTEQPYVTGFHRFTGLSSTSHTFEMGLFSLAGTATSYGSSRRMMATEVKK